MTQQEALTLLKMGRNAFVTGPAGSGKTYVINQYIAYLRAHEVPLGITASTGIAATHMGGMTIHAWSGLGIRDNLTDYDLEHIMERAPLRRRMEEAKVLIIDEVSMLHHFRLDLVDTILRTVKKNDLPFGGIQLVLCGDFFQLPPVTRFGEQPAHFIYRAQSWKAANPTICYLHENFRQTDDGILSILNEIRAGDISDGAREQLASRHAANAERSIGSELIEPTRLYTHNIDVDGVNVRELGKVLENEFRYEMSSRGRKPLVEALKKSCLAPEVLCLKKGARVMCVKNNFDKGYVNGTLGVVVSCGPGVDPVIRTAGGRDITIESTSWTIEEDGRILAELNQYPLRLAWAITVHKSQGMSLDAVEVDLSRAFEPGMGYVALSRVRSLAGLSILGMNEQALQVHPEVLEHDRYLRELSAKVESVLEYSDESQIVGETEAFLAKVAPLYALRKKNGSLGKSGTVGRNGKPAKVKPMKITTYEKTAMHVLSKKSLREIARERDMTAETIVAHLEKLVEFGPTERGLSQSDIAYFKNEIPRAHFEKIEQALEKVAASTKGSGQIFLSPVKNLLGPQFSFLEIRLARVLLGYVKKRGE